MTAPFCPECGPTCPLHSTTAFLDPLHDELDRLRTLVVDLQNDIRDSDNLLEQAEARVDQLTDQLTLANDTLRHRGNAVNATGATNDQLRATIARIEKLADGPNQPGLWVFPAGDDDAPGRWVTYLRAALDGQEIK